jgi:Domain of unknown function (DUF4177)
VVQVAQQFEYRVVQISGRDKGGKLQSQLDERGAEGWRAINVIGEQRFFGNTFHYMIIFERPVIA